MILRNSEEAPFDASTWGLFRKHIFTEMLMEANKYLPAYKDDDSNGNIPPSAGNPGNNDAGEDDANKRLLILDAACESANICYP